MSNSLAKTYNQISDVFSRAQIKTAVESLERYSDRLKLIDSIIDRRQQIRQANDLSKITKFAHIFKKMIQRYRDKKEDQLSTQRLQMQMVMSMFTNKNKQSPKHNTRKYDLKKLDTIQTKKFREIADKRRDAVQLKSNNKNGISLPLNFEEKRGRLRYQNNNQVISPVQFSNRASRFLSDYVTNVEKDKDTMINSEKVREIKSLEGRIKQSSVLKTRINLYLHTKEFESFNRIFSKYQMPIRKKQCKQQYPLLSSRQMDDQEYQKYLGQVQAQLSQEESFVSYTERKLNQLYSNSTLTQTRNHQSSSVQSQLITMNKQIIDLSNKKLYSFKQ